MIHILVAKPLDQNIIDTLKEIQEFDIIEVSPEEREEYLENFVRCHAIITDGAFFPEKKQINESVNLRLVVFLNKNSKASDIVSAARKKVIVRFAGSAPENAAQKKAADQNSVVSILRDFFNV